MSTREERESLASLLKKYGSVDKEVAGEAFTGSDVENELFAYLNGFICVSDGTTYVLSNTRARRLRLESEDFNKGGWVAAVFKRNYGVVLTQDHTIRSKKLTDLGARLLLLWREYKGLCPYKGHPLEEE